MKTGEGGRQFLFNRGARQPIPAFRQYGLFAGNGSAGHGTGSLWKGVPPFLSQRSGWYPTHDREILSREFYRPGLGHRRNPLKAIAKFFPVQGSRPSETFLAPDLTQKGKRTSRIRTFPLYSPRATIGPAKHDRAGSQTLWTEAFSERRRKEGRSKSTPPYTEP